MKGWMKIKQILVLCGAWRRPSLGRVAPMALALGLAFAAPAGAQIRHTPPIFQSIDLTNIAITGGAIDGTPIGATTPSTGAFTTLTASGDTTLSNPLLFGNDNSDDIGATGATRPRTAYLGTSLRVQSDTGVISLGASDDVILTWDAANRLALRNSTNEQTVRIFGTWTDASNYEGMEFEADASGNRMNIKAIAAGSGATGDLYLMQNTVNRIRVRSGNIMFYDDIIFATDNTHDFGDNGVNRVRDIFIAGQVSHNVRQAVTVDGATTFAITSDYVLLACTGAESIDTITGGKPGARLYIEHTDTECTINDDDDATAANAVDLTGAATNDVGAVGKIITLLYNGTHWLQVGESDN